MKQLKEMPEEGQFVAVWEYNGEVWSGIYKIEEGVYAEYDSFEDEWKETQLPQMQHNLTFLVKD